MPRPKTIYDEELEKAANIRAARERSQKKREETKQAQQNGQQTAPVSTTSNSSASVANRAKYQTSGDTNLYYKNAEKAYRNSATDKSSLITRNYRDYGDRGSGRYYTSASKIRDKSSNGAGTRKTYTNIDGTTGTYYERSKSAQAQYNTMFNRNMGPSYTNNAAAQAYIQNKKKDQNKAKAGDLFTQESANTGKYDDGRRTEYFERQNGQWVSVPEERYKQTKALDNGINPSTLTTGKRVQAAAEHGLKNAVHGLKSTWGAIQANKNDQQRARDYAATHKDGNNLNRRRDMLMNSYDAASATRAGNDARANEYIKQEALEDIMNERRQLEEQQRIDQRYQAYKDSASKAGQFVMDVVDTTANMAPGMVSNFILPGSFIPEMAVQSFGNSYNQARNNGASRDEAILSGIQNAAVESLSEMMFAGGRALGKATGVKGFFRPGKAIEEAPLGFIKSTAGKDVVRTVQKLGLAGSEEGAEEIVAGLVEPVLDTLIYQGGVETLKDPEFWTSTVHDALYNGLVGFASGGGFGTIDVMQSIAQGSNIRANADVANMINQGLAMPEGSTAYLIARKLDAQYQANPDTLGNLDVSDLSRAIQESMQTVQADHNKQMEYAERALDKEKVGGTRTYAQEDYLNSVEADERAERGEISKEEAALSHTKAGDEFGEIYKAAAAKIQERITPTLPKDASAEEIESAHEDARKKAERVAQPIARIMTGEGTARDTAAVLGDRNAREVFEEISGKKITGSNEEAIKQLNEINSTNHIVYAKKQAQMDKEDIADSVFGDDISTKNVLRQILASTDSRDIYPTALAAQEAFIAGRSGSDMLPTAHSNFLTSEEFRQLYKAGRNAKDLYAQSRVDLLKKKAAQNKARNEGSEKQKASVKISNKAKASKKVPNKQMMRFFGRVAKKYGVTIEIVDRSEIQGNANGEFVGNTIRLAADLGSGVRGYIPTFSHEFTHFLEDMAPEAYQKLYEFVLSKSDLTKDSDAFRRIVNAKMDLYRQYGLKTTLEAAQRECIADMAQTVFTEENIAEFIDIEPNIARDVINAVIDIVNNFIELMKNSPDLNSEGNWIHSLGEYEEYRKLWMDAAKLAAERAKSGVQISERKKPVASLHGFNGFDKSTLNDLKTKGIEIVQNETDFEGHIKRALSTKKNNEQRTVALGSILDNSLNRIEAELGESLFNKKGQYSFLVTYDAIRHIEKHFHTVDEIKAELRRVYDMVSAFDSIERQYENNGTQKKLVIEKAYPDWEVLSVEIVSGKNRSLILKTVYYTKKGSQAGRSATSTGSYDAGSTPSNNPIPQTQGGSNQNTQEEQSRKQIALDSVGMTEQNGKAAWLPERIDRLIRQSGAEGSPEYAKDYAVMMNPRDFLKLTIPDDTLDRWSSAAQNVPDEVKGLPFREAANRVVDIRRETGKWIHDNENYPLDQEELARQEQTPFLIIDAYDNPRIVGHEGRHRMRALMEAGITSVPVIINDTTSKYSKTNTGSMRLKAQNFGNGPVNNNAIVVVNDLVPINEAHKDELLEKFGAKGDEQVRFQMQTPVEQKGDLIAVHNLWEEDLMNTIRLGGFPMPSIAVTKTGMGHSKYGSITLLFNKDTIDPKKSKANEIFGGDAYTPTFPSVSKKINSQAVKRIRERIEGILGNDIYNLPFGLRDPGLDSTNMSDKLQYRDPYEAYGDSEVLKIAYLQGEKGFDVAIPMKEGELKGHGKDFWELIDDYMPAFTINDVYNGTMADIMEEYEPAVRKAMKAYYEAKYSGSTKLLGIRKTLLKKYDEPLGFDEVMRIVEGVASFRTSGIQQVIDNDALKKLLDEKVDADGYRKWIDDLFDGIIEKEGIRNSKDPFTPSGNRRSWEQLHDPVTLENVVKSMKQQLSAGANGLFGSNPKGAAQKKYGSISEVRADKDRLMMLPDEEFGRLESEATDMLSKVCASIAEHNKGRYYNPFGSILDTGEYIAEILNRTRSKASIKRSLEKDYNLEVTDEEMDDLMDAIDAIANLPTGYFEAKPRRAVGLNEIKMAVVPDSASTELKDALRDNGIDYVEYESGNEEDRLAKVNEQAEEKDVRFQIQIDTTEEEQYNELKDKVLTVPVISESVDYTAIPDVIGDRSIGQVKDLFWKYVKGTEITRGLSVAHDINKSITINRGSIKETVGQQISSGYGGSLEDLIYELPILKPVLQNAIHIKTTPDKYVGTSRENKELEKVYVLFSAYQKGNAIYPVLIEIKSYISGANNLHLSVVLSEMEGISGRIVKKEGVVNAYAGNSQPGHLLPSREYSLTDIVSQVNPSDFGALKYLPDQMLSDKQKEGKAKGIALDEVSLDRVRARDREKSGEGVEENVRRQLQSDRDREIADLRTKVDRLQREKRRTYGREASNADATRVAKALLNDTSSDYSLNKTINGIKKLFTQIRRGDDFSEIYGTAQDIARSVADSSYDMVEIPGAQEEAELRQRFLDARKKRGGSPIKIMIPQNMIGDFDQYGGWKEFRAAHKGIVTLSVNSGMAYDSFVGSILEEFGEQLRFDAEIGDDSIDSLVKIIEAADSQEAKQPVRKAYKDEDVEGYMPDDVDMGIMGGWRDEEVNFIIDRLLDDVADQIAPDLTFADRKAAEKDAAVRRARENERAKWEARREKWKADRDKRLAEMKEDKKLAVEAQRAKGKERLRKQAEMYRRQRERARDRRAETASRRKTLDRIYKTTQRLSQRLLKPTDNQHIPEKYRKAVADMLGWLDFENARTDQWAKRHGNVPSARILNMRKLQEVYAKIADDEQLNQYIEPDDQIYEWLEYLSDIEGSRLDDLTTDQLRTVRLILDAVSWQINNADKTLTEGLKANRMDLATKIMNEMEAQKEEKMADGVIKRFLKADSTPVHFFERLGSGTLKEMYKQLTLAQDAHIKHLSEAQEYIEKNVTGKWGNTAKIGNNSKIKKWTEESQKFTLADGKTIELTGAQVMSLYALNKREQARKHLLGGGIMIAPAKVKRDLKGGVKEYLLERQLSKTRARVSYEDITKILSSMSKDQIDCAEAMLKYLKTTSEWGNETSMKLYGYRKFTEENYFPIQSAKEFIASSNLEVLRDKKIKNQGMTKNVNEYANNPIVIDDFFDVTTAHINQMSQYNSFVPILEDFDRVYQYVELDEDHIVQRSVKELIEQKHGRWAADYIENLLKNVNGNFGNEVADIQGFETLLRNWKAAKIGMSVRVFAQQPTAVVRAFNEISPKYFVGTPRRGSHKRMWEICPIAEWKHWGYSQTDIHRSMRDTMLGDKHITDKLFFDMYGKADDLGWGAIFDAVERETKSLMKKGKLDFEYDSAEYRQHVNERFRHIVDRTQVVDSVLHRSQMMRSQNTLTKAMTAFMAEPTVSINTIMTSFAKAQDEFRKGNKAAGTKAATRGVTVFVANAVAVSLMASLISAIRESYLPGDDDDEEKELSRIQQSLVDHGVEEGSLLYDWMTGYFVEDFKDNINPLALMPVTKDMINMIQGFESPNPMYALPQGLIKNAQNIKKWIDEDGDTRYSGRYYIERAAESIAELFGIPAPNIRKELQGITNIYFRAISEKEYGDYLQDRWELNEEYKSNKNIFIDHYLNAKKAGHDESAKDIREQLLKSKVKDDEGNLVFTDDAIQKRAWSVYAPEYKDDVIAGRDVSKQEKDLKSVGITQEDIDDKKSKALVSSISDAVEAGDTDRISNLYGVLEKYGYGEYDVDKKVKSAASDLMYDAIDLENYDEADRYIKVITDVTGYTKDDVVQSITTHYMSDYYEAMDSNNYRDVSRAESIMNRYGVTSSTIKEKEAEHYKDYYRQKAYMAYASGNQEEAYRIANEYNTKYPGVYAKGTDGMLYGLQNLSDETIRRYTTSSKYAEWQLP